MKLAKSYPNYVDRCVRAGMQRLLPIKRIFKLKTGKPLISGAFAVPKDTEEDRGISALCPLNSWIDDAKMVAPKFAMPSRLRCVGGPWLKRLGVSKKDVRHFSTPLLLDPDGTSS